jgi:hypothetical protein
MTLKLMELLPPSDIEGNPSPRSTVILVTQFSEDSLAFHLRFGELCPVVNVTCNNDDSWVR